MRKLIFYILFKNRKIVGTTIKKKENNITNRDKPRARIKLSAIYKTS